MKDKLHAISLGAGVQSSVVALMAAKGEITPMPSCAIFSDVGAGERGNLRAEPERVYEWLDWLEKQLPFPVHRVHSTKGNLIEASQKMRTSKKTGKQYWCATLPFFTLEQVTAAKARKGILRRQCTEDFKILPLVSKLRELCGIKRAPRGKVLAVNWIGISWDEIQRMKQSRNSFIENRWPLIELKMRRSDCLDWMKRNGYPEPPRSACYFCPYHSNKEWGRMKKENPKEFEMAVKFEETAQKLQGDCEVLRGKPFLHNSLVPLKEIDFSDEGMKQYDFGFINECSGNCGL